MTGLPWLPWIFAGLSLAWAVYLKGHSNRVHKTDAHDQKIERQDERIRQLELQVARQESPAMKRVQDLLSEALHHPDPTHSRQDFLLEKLDKTILTPLELPELRQILTDRMADPTTPTAEIEYARTLLAIMPLVVTERAAVAKIAQAQEAPPDALR